MKITLLLTFDHELPLGDLHTDYHSALFEPTNTLLQLAAKKQVPITLFSDILCAIRYKTWDYNGFYLPYQRQLQQTLAMGNDVQLHLHPHWLTSNYKNNKVIPSSDFALANFRNHTEYNIGDIINLGKTSLEEICIPALTSYKTIAYRAGGYNIEPASKEIFTQLAQHGIIYDSSIPLGFYYASALSLVDFRRLPNLPNWYIDNSGDFRHAAEKGIMEIPIACIPKPPFEIPTRFKLKKYAHRAPTTHGTMLHFGKPPSALQKFNMLFSSRTLSFDNHTLTPQYLMRILNYNVNRFRNHQHIVMASCSHPKTMGDYSFSLMEDFIDLARDKYPYIEFNTFAGLNMQP